MGYNGQYRKNVVEEVQTISSVDWYGVPYTTVTVNEYNILNGFTGYTSGGTFFSYNGITENTLASLTDEEYDERVINLLSTIKTISEIEKQYLIIGSTGVDLISCPIPPPTTVAPTTAAPTTVAPTTAAPTTAAPTTAAPTTAAPTTAAPILIYWNSLKQGGSGSNLTIFVNGIPKINKPTTTTLQFGNFSVDSGDEIIIRNSWTSGSGNISKCRVCDFTNGGEIDYTEAKLDGLTVEDTPYTIAGSSLLVSLRSGGLTPMSCAI